MSSTGLYTLLGVEQTASAREIKKGFHKMSLLYHPDKNPEQGPEMFPAIQRAHEVLTNPQKKAIYDQAGEAGLKQIEMMGGGVPPWVLSAGKSLLSCMLCLLSLLFLLFAIFVSMRAEGSVDWSWNVVFAPLWILDGLVLVGTGCVLQTYCQKSADPDDDDPPEKPSILTPFKSLSLVAFHITLVLKLDGAATYTFTTAFAPLFAVLALNLLTASWTGLARLPLLGQAAGEASSDKVVLFFRKCYAFLDAISLHLELLVFAVLMALKVDALVDWSWAIIFLPIYAPCAFFWLVDTTIVLACSHADRPEGGPSPLAPQCFVLVGHSFLYITVGLLVTRLEGGASAGVSAAVAILPVLLVLGCLCCCSCLVFILPMPEDLSDEDEDESNLGRQDDPTPAPVDTLTTPLIDPDARPSSSADVAVDIVDGEADDMD